MKKRQCTTTTTDLADFGFRERCLLIDILNAWNEQGLPEDFCDEEVQVMFNKSNGFVFLANSEYQDAMMNGDFLEIFHHCGNCGYEGYAGIVHWFDEDCCAECAIDEYEEQEEAEEAEETGTKQTGED